MVHEKFLSQRTKSKLALNLSMHTSRKHDPEFVQGFITSLWPHRVAKCTIFEKMGSMLTFEWWQRFWYEWWEGRAWAECVVRLLRQSLRQELTSRSILDSRSFRLGLRNYVCIGVILHLDHKVTVLLKLRVTKDPIQCSFQVIILIK